MAAKPSRSWLAKAGGSSSCSPARCTSIETPASARRRPSTEKNYKPEEELELSRGGLTFAWIAIKKNRLPTLILLGWGSWRLLSDAPWSWLDNAVVATFGLTLAISLFLYWSARRYLRMVHAAAAGRWEETLRRIAGLERSYLRSSIPPSDFAFRRAQALIALGREEEALRSLQNLDRTGVNAEWILQARLADVHVRRRDLKSARACLDLAIEQAAGQPEAHLALAEFLAGCLARDPAGAREALERARESPLSADVRWGVERIEGMIAIEEERWQDALDFLARCRAAFLKIPDAGSIEVILAQIAAYQAIALAGLGRQEEARAALDAAKVEAWLRPHFPELVERAYKAVAG